MIKTGTRTGPSFLKVEIALKTGETFVIEKEEIRGDSVQFSDASSDAGTFSIGYATMKTFTFGIDNSSKRYSSYDFDEAEAIPYIINNGKSYLKGRYEVYEPKVKGRSIELLCYDSMYDTEKEYNTELTFPSTLRRMMQECSIKCKFVLADSHFPNEDLEVAEKPNIKTWRQLIAYIAQCAGCYARFNVRDELELKGYDRSAFTPSDSYNGGYFDKTSAKKYQSGDNLDGGDFTFSESTHYDGGVFGTHTHHNIFRFKSTEIATDDTVITGINIKVGDTEYLHGSKDYMLQISNNPLITEKNVQTVITHLVSRYVGLRFRKMTAICLGDFSIEAGDAACLWDSQNNEYRCYITNLSYKLNGPMTVSNAAEARKKNNYGSGNTVTKLLELADKETQKRVSQYQQMQEYFNSLALNMFGMYYFTELDEDGKAIHYGSNTPDLKDSTYAWKDGSKGFFISKDGGKTWTYGRDSDGNVVANILAAVGIVAKWINTRGLKATDNEGNITFEIDAVTGECRFSASAKAGDSSLEDMQAAISANAKGLSSKMSQGDVNTLIAQNAKKITLSLTNNATSAVLTLSGGGIEAQSKTIKFTGEIVFASSLTDGTTKVSGSNISGGTLSLGGSNNGYGKLSIYNASARLMGSWDNRGLFTNDVVVIGDLCMAGTVAYTLDVDGADQVKARIMNLGFKTSSTGTTGTYALYIGNPNYNWEVAEAYAYIPFVFRDTVTMNKSLKVSGTKERVAQTEHYAERSLYAYEMASPIFGDIGEGMTDETGECYISLDDIFSETVTADMEYQVFLQKEGPGDVWVEQKMPSYFTVKGTPNLKFAWEIKAKQKGYELDRMEDNLDRGLAFYEGPESTLAGEASDFVKQQEALLLGEQQSIIVEREEFLYETA